VKASGRMPASILDQAAGGCDRKSFAHARGAGTDRGAAAAIAHVIEKNAAAAACLRRKDIVLRRAFDQGTHQPQGITVGFVMRRLYDALSAQHLIDGGFDRTMTSNRCIVPRGDALSANRAGSNISKWAQSRSAPQREEQDSR
jgi:hypothetical protein